MHPLLGIAAVLVTLAVLMALLKVIEHWLQPPAELVRKLLHVGMGSVVLTFPWLFDRTWPVVLLAAIATAALAVVRLAPALRDGVGTVLNRVQRPSLGEIYFAIAVGVLFWLSAGNPLLFCLPMLIMTLADATAALIGLAYGKVRYLTSDGLKSAEGSIAFFAIAFLSVHVPLLLLTDTGRAETLLIALVIGILAMLLEAIAWRGLDNLLIPLGAYAFLRVYLNESVEPLMVRLVATLAFLALALSWRRRSSLDDSALMTAALFGYGALMLGNRLWLIGPVMVFLAHTLIWPRHGPRRQHTVWAVLAVITTALLWLALNVRQPSNHYYHAYAVTFGAHLAIFGVSYIPLSIPRHRQWRGLAGWVLIGWVLALIQVIFTIAPAAIRLTAPALSLLLATLAGVAVGGGVFFLLRPYLYDPRRSDARVHSAGFAAGLLGSLVAFAIETLIHQA